MRIMSTRQFCRTKELYYAESEFLILFFRFAMILAACMCCYEQTWGKLIVALPCILLMVLPIAEYLRDWLWSEVREDIIVLPKATDVELLEESR